MPPPPIFAPHRFSHREPARQGCHTALLNLQRAGVVKCLQAFCGFYEAAMGVGSGVELTAAAVSCFIQEGIGKAMQLICRAVWVSQRAGHALAMAMGCEEWLCGHDPHPSPPHLCAMRV